MTDDRMALIEPVWEQADGDLLREMPAFAAQWILEGRGAAEEKVRSEPKSTQRHCPVRIAAQ